MRKGNALLLLSIAIFIFLIVPIFSLVYGSSFFPVIGQPTFTFLQFVTSPSALTYVTNTLEFSIAAAIISVLLAVVYAWIVARTNIPGKKLFELIPILGLTMPLLVKALAWIYILDPRVGIANQLARLIFGPNALTLNIYSIEGLVFAVAMGAIPIAYLIILPAMKSLDTSLEEASVVSGHGFFKTFTKISGPLVLPAILSAFVLVVVGNMGNFDYPLLIAQPAHFPVLSTEVYFWTEGRSPPSYGSAGIISILYVMITLTAVGIYLWITRRSYKYVVVTGKGFTSGVRKLHSWKMLAALIFCSAILFLQFIFPFSAIVLDSTTNFFTAGFTNLLKITFPAGYVQAAELPLFYSAIYDTVIMALITAVTATAVGTLLSYVALRSKVRGARLTEYISNIPLAFPGVVYGIALFWTFLLLPGISVLFGTIWPLVVAVTFVRLPVSTRIVSSNMMQISGELEEASYVGGAGFFRMIWRVLVPLIKDGLANSFIYTFVESMRELGAVVFLVTPQTLVFTTLILEYYNRGLTNPTLAIETVAAASVDLTLIVSVALVIFEVLQHFLSKERKISLFQGIVADPIALKNETS